MPSLAQILRAKLRRLPFFWVALDVVETRSSNAKWNYKRLYFEVNVKKKKYNKKKSAMSFIMDQNEVHDQTPSLREAEIKELNEATCAQVI